MPTDDFFEKPTKPSLIKATIVEKYFAAWAGVMINVQDKPSHAFKKRIGYVDLFSGPGYYEDGTPSTPIRIIKKAIENPKIHTRLISYFFDKNSNFSKTLEQKLNELPGIGKFKFKPKVYNHPVNEELVETFGNTKKIPMMVFIDPWGYKGLSLELTNSFLKDWGSDCIFFFNYKRINAALSNPYMKKNMAALFGENRSEDLFNILDSLGGPSERENIILKELESAMREFGYDFVLPFTFKNESGNRTTHHLVLVTKNFKGYDLMKGIMAKESHECIQGVPSYIYTSQRSLGFCFEKPIDDLCDLLLKDFAGKTLKMSEIYEQHSVGKLYIKKNYKDALIKLEKTEKIRTEGRKSSRGFADYLKAIFPEKE